MKDDRLNIGRTGEQIATKYLINKGYFILENNYRTRYGEIDIVARSNQTIIFVEVRTRTTISKGTAKESIHQRKQHQVRKMAKWYLYHNRSYDYLVRFDVISVFITSSKIKLDHIISAF